MAPVGSTQEAGREGFLRLKSVLDRLGAELAAGPVEYRAAREHLYHPGRTAGVWLRGGQVGVLGELHPETLAVFGVEGRAVALDVDTELLVKASGERKAAALPRYPAVDRDLAVVVAEEAPAAELLAAIRGAGGELLEAVGAFDEYRGSQVDGGHKSIAVALTFRSPSRTLTDAEVDSSMAKIRAALQARHGARFRT